jgi:hypothetical protein
MVVVFAMVTFLVIPVAAMAARAVVTTRAAVLGRPCVFMRMGVVLHNQVDGADRRILPDHFARTSEPLLAFATEALPPSDPSHTNARCRRSAIRA